MSPKPKFRKVVIEYPPVPRRKWRAPKTEHVPQPFNRKPIKRTPQYPKTLKIHPSTLTKVWHRYRVIEDGVAILYGQYALNDLRFPFLDRGKQGPAICFAAIGFTKLCEMQNWDVTCINKVINIGQELYKSSIIGNKSSCTCKSPKEVQNAFFIDKFLIVLGQDPNPIIGPLKEEKENQGLLYKLKKAFEISKYLVLEMNSKFLAIWKHGGSYYVFDPNDRNSLLLRCKEGFGVPCLIKFTIYKRMIDDLLINYGQSMSLKTIPGFTITPIFIKKIIETHLSPPGLITDVVPPKEKNYEKPIDSCLATKIPKPVEKKEVTTLPPAPPPPGIPTPLPKKPAPKKSKTVDETPERESNTPSIGVIVDIDRIEEQIEVVPVIKPRSPSVTYFKEIIPNKIGIIRASYHQNDPEFSTQCGKQSLANGVAAIAMLRINKSKYWFPRILDDILITGETIYLDSVKSFTGDNVLNLKNLLKKFKLSRYYFTPEIEESTVIGKLGSTKYNILDLQPALEEFFTEHDTGLIRGPVLLAVWSEQGKYYMFDPNERNKNGMAIPKTYKMGDNPEISTSEPGVACLTWYTSLGDLVNVYIQNLERSQRKEHFFISKVEIKDYVEIPEMWYNFNPVRPGKWILRGTFSQNHTRFSASSRNTQCTAIATLAVVYRYLKPVKYWDRSTIDYLIIEGDLYYNKCIEALKERNKFQQKMLMMCELLDNYLIDEKELTIGIEECLINGVLQAPDNFEFPNLRKGINEFFRDNDSGVITAKGLSVGIWKDEDSYFYFDSHARGPKGYDDYGGTSCLIRFQSLNDLSKIINANLGVGTEEIFNIARVDVRIKIKQPDGTIKPDFNEYKEITANKGILRGNFHQGDAEIFDINADKQTMANLLISLGMASVYPCDLWDKDIIDKILMLGDTLYSNSRTEYIKQDLLNAANWESVENPRNMDLVNEENILREFKIGINIIKVDFGPVIEGIFEPDVRHGFEDEEEHINTLQTLLFSALEDFSIGNESSKNEIILESESISLAIWKDNRIYYVFDPTGKDSEGNFFGRDLWSAKIIIQDEDYEEELEQHEEVLLQIENPPKTKPRTSAAGSKTQSEPPASRRDSKNRSETKDLKIASKKAIEVPPPPEVIPEPEMTEEEAEGEEIETEDEYFVEKIDTSDSKACTLMFTCFEDVYNHIIENITPNKRNGQFKMFPMQITMEPELKIVTDPIDRSSGNWFNFVEIDRERWILRGTINMHNRMFPEVNKGKQYSSICISACAYGRLYALPKFTSATVDHIIKYGDKMHTAIRKIREKELKANQKELGLTDEDIQIICGGLEIKPCETLKQFYMGNFLVMCTINTAIITGDVTKDWLPKLNPLAAKKTDSGSNTSDPKGRNKAREEKKLADKKKEEKKSTSAKKKDISSKTSAISNIKMNVSGVVDDTVTAILGLKGGISKFFEEEHLYAIINAKGKSVSVWRLNNFYYLFDPESRGPNGLQETNGTGCILRFVQLNKLIETIDKNLERGGDNIFTIDEVVIHSKEGKRPEPEVTKIISKDPKITAFNEITPGKMILRGNFHQDNTKFGVPKNACGATNAIVALAMAQIHRAATWTKVIVDEVLTNAFKLYKQTVTKLGCDFNSWDDQLTLDLVNCEFNLGIKVVHFERNTEDVKRGILKIKSANILSLRRGLEDFFLEFNYGVIECDLLTTAIWIDDDLFYLFDPNSRSSTGIYMTGGRASLIVFKSITMLADQFLLNIPEEFYNLEYKITPVELKIKEKTDEKKPLKKAEILKITEIDSMASGEDKKQLVKSKSRPKYNEIEIACDKHKAKLKPTCYCPDKGTLIIKKEDKTNLAELTPEEKKEWARRKSEEKKLRQLQLMEIKMRKEFYILENGDSILRAKYSQNSERFSPNTRNRQSIPNALVALVMLKLHCPNTWTHANIEIVLDSADVLYKDSFVMFKPANPKLGLRNVLRTFYILNLKISTIIYKPCLAGSCTYEELFRALLNFFLQDNSAILLGDSLTVAVYQKAGQYYMFDPHDRNAIGTKCAKGCACLMRFETLENLVLKYTCNIESEEEQFTLCAVKVQGVKKSDK